MSADTGGPAFPQQDDASGSEGMTLRDYFAAKAMQAALSRHGFYDDEPQFAAWCYETADAMLKAREA
jgi:hypothetical protein